MAGGGGFLNVSRDGAVLLAAAAALQLSRGRSEDEIGLMAAFFTALGDNLALYQAIPHPENGERSACP